MGLDQHAYKMKHDIDKDVDFNKEIQDVDVEQIHYWRKHPNLHGFMENLYIEKGGISREFNCRPVKLTQEDIDKLAEVILDKNLPETEGFFFGESLGDKEQENDDLDFCKKASQALKKGYTVYYDSWW
jgi:hypothetical protein